MEAEYILFNVKRVYGFLVKWKINRFHSPRRATQKIISFSRIITAIQEIRLFRLCDQQFRQLPDVNDGRHTEFNKRQKSISYYLGIILSPSFLRHASRDDSLQFPHSIVRLTAMPSDQVKWKLYKSQLLLENNTVCCIECHITS